VSKPIPYVSIGAWGAVIIFIASVFLGIGTAWVLFPLIGERGIDLLVDQVVPYSALGSVVWFSACLAMKAVKG